MIKLSGSRFTDIMPENLAEQPEIQALAYAVGRQVEKLLAYADGARTYAAIYAVPEKALDLLAEPTLPAQMVRPSVGDLIWVVDEAAATGQD